MVRVELGCDEKQNVEWDVEGKVGDTVVKQQSLAIFCTPVKQQELSQLLEN
jgi:hypothetical protein